MPGAVLHCASVGGPRPTGTTVGVPPLFEGGFWVLHTQGCTCGPAKIGPPIGLLVMTMRAPRPSASSAVRVLRPTVRPVTNPTPLALNALVTLRLPTVTVSASPSVPAGRLTRSEEHTSE